MQSLWHELFHPITKIYCLASPVVHTVVLQYIYFLKKHKCMFYSTRSNLQEPIPSSLRTATSNQAADESEADITSPTTSAVADAQEASGSYTPNTACSSTSVADFSRPSSAASDVLSPPSRPPKKRKTSEATDSIEVQLLERWDQFTKMQQQPQPKRGTALFGEEVAESLEHITDDYTREVAKQEIRSILFNYRFRSNPRSSAENVSQIGSQTFMNLN